MSRRPPLCHSEPVRAAEQVPLGYTLAWESVLPKRETDCRVAALLAMTARRCRADGTSRTPCPAVRDVEDAVPYRRADRVVRPYDGDGKRVRRDGGDGVSCGWYIA